MEDDDGVIRPDFQAKHTLTIRGDEKFCAHRDITVSEFDRVIQCAKCEAVLDTFEVLLQYAKNERDGMVLAADIRDKKVEMDALLRQEKRLKSRIARAKTKASKQGVMF